MSEQEPPHGVLRLTASQALRRLRCSAVDRLYKWGGLKKSREDGHREELVDEALCETFPASDPLSVFTRDEPPINAQAKWDADEADALRRGLSMPTRH